MTDLTPEEMGEFTPEQWEAADKLMGVLWENLREFATERIKEHHAEGNESISSSTVRAFLLARASDIHECARVAAEGLHARLTEVMDGKEAEAN